MDLSFVLQTFLGYTSFYFVKTLMFKKIKLRYYLLLIFTCGFSLFLIYLNIYLSILIYIMYVMVIMIIVYKKQMIKALLLYMFCYTLLTFIIDKLSIYNSCYNFILIINNSKGIFSYIFCPLFFLGLIISTKIVDCLYRLNTYKTVCYLSKNNSKYSYTCYYDTGNTLKHNDIPVIFINKDIYKFKLEEGEEIEIKTVNGREKRKVQSCLLSLEDKKESYFVYVVLVEENDFNGCEILLNAYL